MPARREPVSRRDRPAKPALSRGGIIATAVRIMRAEGLERVTMRRLATELDTGPASLYVYVANTAELRAAILEEMLGEVDLSPVKAAGDWRERVEIILGSYGDVLAENPGLARSTLVARPSGPNYVNLLDALLTLMAEGSVPDAQAAWGVDVVLLMATAQAVEHGGRADDVPGSSPDWNALASALNEASPSTAPRVATLGAAMLLSGPPHLRRRWAFRVLLDGILHTPVPVPTAEG